MSPPTFVAAIAPGEAPQGLTGVESAQAFDAAGYIRPCLLVGWHELSQRVDGSRDGAHGGA
jgi:hypothetical protein